MCPRKFTRKEEKQLREFMEKMDMYGVLTVDEWTSGSGRFTSNRALPPFVERFERKEYPRHGLPKHGTTERTAYNFFQDNPRRKYCLVLDEAAMYDFLFDCAHLKEY